MKEVEQQIKELLNKYANTATEKYLLEAELRLLISLAERDQMIKDHNSTLEILRKK